VQRDLNDRKLSIDEFPIPAEVLGYILKLIVDGKLTTKSARDLYGDLLELPREEVTRQKADEIIADKGLEVVEDTGALDSAIESVLAEPKNEKTIADVKGGKQQAVGPLIGQVMKQVKGADPKTVREMLLKKISE